MSRYVMPAARSNTTRVVPRSLLERGLPKATPAAADVPGPVEPGAPPAIPGVLTPGADGLAWTGPVWAAAHELSRPQERVTARSTRSGEVSAEPLEGTSGLFRRRLSSAGRGAGREDVPGAVPVEMGVPEWIPAGWRLHTRSGPAVRKRATGHKGDETLRAQATQPGRPPEGRSGPGALPSRSPKGWSRQPAELYRDGTRAGVMNRQQVTPHLYRLTVKLSLQIIPASWPRSPRSPSCGARSRLPALTARLRVQ
ncbi:hypothetical protein HNQ10_000677 [Deinococcus metallilatus]|uniref:Uncharacterized protein n=1 Tax=Deinococcus metallilatus TaxID=1211322 RepID=A0ABR6MPJ7_9DEIO|nr:hypothetical protein [Deinococcus metallilatus]